MATKTPAIPGPSETKLLPPPHDAAPRPRRRSFAWLWILLFAGLGYGGYRYYQSLQAKQAAAAAQSAKAPRSVSVVSAPVKVGDVPVYLTGLGTVTPYNTVSVKSRVDGQLISVHFTEG